tara:strand:- start:1780 stop:2406 length:627 start_codon:yes stop_codon:yes gene_type:complete
MKIELKKINGKGSGKKINIPDTIFNIKPNDHAIYLDIKNHLANKRQGTSKVKERGEIVGSTKKIKKQKGTGTARAGSIKSPLFKGGGQIFGPKPRDYNSKVNKKLKILARKSALSYKINEKSLTVLENFKFNDIKTKKFISILNALSIDKKRSLFIIGENDQNLLLSSRNVNNSSVKNIDDISTYDIIKSDNLILTENSLDKLKSILN